MMLYHAYNHINVEYSEKENKQNQLVLWLSM